MSNFAAFQGTFSDFRTVKGRKVIQLIIEVPHELGNVALQALGGIPDPANPVWVAVARLDAKQAEAPKQIEAPKEKKRWEDMLPAQQAAIRCNEPEFQKFLDRQVCALRGWSGPKDANEAAQVVRHFCKVDSRAELNTKPDAAVLWGRLDTDFWAWQRGYQQ